MNKHDALTELFGPVFHTDNLRVRCKVSGFSCPHMEACGVRRRSDPIYTGVLGDQDTRIMVVAEAPSSAGGKGPHTSGLFSELVESSRSPIVYLREFVQREFGTVPYFTDLIKCGVANQRDKARLDERETNCIGMFLRRELEILQPEVVLCIGVRAHNAILELKERYLDASTQVVKLLHYSRNAMLPLSPEDKRDIIWKWQIRNVPGVDKTHPVNLADLSYFTASSD